MRLRDVTAVLEDIAPTRYAEPWDNVGLLVGDPEQTVSRAMFAIDYTPEVAAEAAGDECDVVVAYHPPIFKPLKHVLAGGGTGSVYDAVRRGVAIYSPHTAWDVAAGGTNDLLADVLGLADRGPLKTAEGNVTQYKLVTFAPADAADRVSDAVFAAGAGHIGHYAACSFRTEGTGTFFGEPGSHPTVGHAGRLERTREIKIETVVPTEKVDAVVRALRKAHPYEEPAFDLNVLGTRPEARGIGRVGDLPAPTPRATLVERVKTGLGLDQVLVAGPLEGDVTRAACCAGACGDLLDNALATKAQFYLTGEMRHHDALRAARAGVTVVCTLHSNSERASLKRLASRLTDRLPDLATSLSRQDRDPFQIR